MGETGGLRGQEAGILVLGHAVRPWRGLPAASGVREWGGFGLGPHAERGGGLGDFPPSSSMEKGIIRGEQSLIPGAGATITS